MIVRLTAPNGTYCDINCYEINDMCKYICNKPENIKKFNKYKKDYTYFEAYYDFVIFELGYKINNMLLDNNNPITKDNKLFLSSDSHLPFIVKCSNKQLSIDECKVKKVYNALIDPNGYKMVYFSDTNPNGSHEITANTVLNQLMIRNKDICDLVLSSKEINPDSVFILNNLGFLRSINYRGMGYIVGYKGLNLGNQLKYRNSYSIEYFEENERIVNNELAQEYIDMVNHKAKEECKSR